MPRIVHVAVLGRDVVIAHDASCRWRLSSSASQAAARPATAACTDISPTRRSRRSARTGTRRGYHRRSPRARASADRQNRAARSPRPQRACWTGSRHHCKSSARQIADFVAGGADLLDRKFRVLGLVSCRHTLPAAELQPRQHLGQADLERIDVPGRQLHPVIYACPAAGARVWLLRAALPAGLVPGTALLG